jgi:hypothetical protein
MSQDSMNSKLANLVSLVNGTAEAVKASDNEPM